MRRILIAALATAGALTAGAAQAQQRTFFCGEDSELTLKVVNAKTITAGLIEGQTLTMKQSPDDKMTYFWGDYSVTISKDQRNVSLMIPDFGEIQCIYQGGGGQQADSQGGGGQVKKTTAPKVQKTTKPEVVVQGGQPKVAAKEPKALSKKPAPKKATVAGAKAKSWGGVVRSGPGMDYPKVASLAEGQPITLLEYADVPVFNGYSWFKIKFGTKTGYQWGGILCGVGKQIPGAFETC
jgi:hypothetical protein